MTLLKLKLRPSTLAARLLFFMLARLISGAAALFVFLFVHFWVGLFLLLVWLLFSVGYYFYLHRLALAVFMIADGQQSAPAGATEGPAGAQ